MKDFSLKCKKGSLKSSYLYVNHITRVPNIWILDIAMVLATSQSQMCRPAAKLKNLLQVVLNIPISLFNDQSYEKSDF